MKNSCFCTIWIPVCEGRTSLALIPIGLAQCDPLQVKPTYLPNSESKLIDKNEGSQHWTLQDKQMCKSKV